MHWRNLSIGRDYDHLRLVFRKCREVEVTNIMYSIYSFIHSFGILWRLGYL